MTDIDNAPRGSHGRAGYRTGDATKRQILEAAYEHFSRFGYHGASLRDIAAQSGISHPGLRHHFTTKEDLLLAVLAEREKRALATYRPTAGRDGLDSLVALVEGNVAAPGLVELFAVLAPQAGDPTHPAHDFFVARYERVRGIVRDGIRQAQDLGEVRPGLDADVAATAVIALMDGLQVQWLIAPERIDLPTAVDTGIRSLLH